MRTGSVTGAAQLLGVSQPAISKTLQYSEDRLGMKLFLRRGGRLFPTAEAEELFLIADTIFEDVARFKRAALDFRDNVSGGVNIATIPTLAESILVAPLSSFLNSHPQVKISLKILNTLQVVNRVARNQADFGLVYGPVNDSSVEWEELCVASFACAVRANSELSAREAVSIADLRAEQVISFHRASPWGLIMQRTVEAAGFSFDVAIECNHSVTALALVEAGAGVALIAEGQNFLGKFPNVVIRPLRPPVALSVQLVYRSSPPPTRLTAAMLAHLRACLRSTTSGEPLPAV